MSEPDTNSTNGKNGVKTMGIRYQPDLHTQMSMIANLRERSFQDEVIAASQAHVAAAMQDPDLMGRLQVAIAEIDRDAASRRDALAALFTVDSNDKATGEGAEQPAEPTSASGKTARPRRGGSSAS